MKYIDADKLIAEIERRKEILDKYRDSFETAACCEQELEWIKEFITSLQREQPSLPSDLDEAAEKNFETMEVLEHENIFEETHRKIFKAGVEWMAGQGVTTEQIVGRTPLNGPNGITVFLYDFDGFEAGDKVVVQIRKK